MQQKGVTQIRLIVELLLLFGGLPLAAVFWNSGILPLIPLIVAAAGGAVILLRIDGWSYRELVGWGSWREWIHMLGLFLLVALVLGAALWYWQPESLFAFAKAEPQMWLLVMCFYPLLSAAPQEFIYRVFFFRRYRSLLNNRALLLVVTSALAFAWGHIVFRNSVALVFALAAGLLFAWRYQRSGSFVLVAVEHGLYGNLIYTLGLGDYFYSGAV